MAVKMSIALGLENNIYTDEAGEIKKNTIVEIPESESVLVYEERGPYGERSIIEAIDFMVKMIELEKREIISHNVAYIYIHDPLASYGTKPDKKYYITIILKSVENDSEN